MRDGLWPNSPTPLCIRPPGDPFFSSILPRDNSLAILGLSPFFFLFGVSLGSSREHAKNQYFFVALCHRAELGLFSPSDHRFHERGVATGSIGAGTSHLSNHPSPPRRTSRISDSFGRERKKKLEAPMEKVVHNYTYSTRWEAST